MKYVTVGRNLNKIKSFEIDARIRINVTECEWFKIDGSMRKEVSRIS